MTRDERPLRLIQGLVGQVPQPPHRLPGEVSDSLPPNPVTPAPSAEVAQALRSSEQRLSRLLDDRGRLGRDLHDCVLQSLYAIGLSLEQSTRVSAAARLKSRASGAAAVNQLNALIQEIRRMITGLQQGTVEAFDLSSELNGLVKTYTEVGRIYIALHLQASALDILTGEEEREILNIAREALSNCIRHAGASRARVALQARKSRVRLIVEDNGMGFDTSHKPRRHGYGLANMAARAKKLGGQLMIQSRAGHGTKIIAEFILEPILAPV